MYSGMLHAHSGLRWIALLLLVIAVVNALMKWLGKKPYEKSDKSINAMTMGFIHLQALTGAILYFISPKVMFAGEAMKDSVLRFYTVEHISLMLIAIILVTIGHARAKRMTDSTKKFKNIFWFYDIALVLILVAIPWPFRGLGAGWF